MTNQIQIRLLGTPTLVCANHSAKLGVGAQALLYYLAAEAQPQSRTRLAGLLWGESDDDLARTSLRRTLSDLRKEIGDCLVSDYQSVTLNPATCSIDLGSFQRGVRQAATLDLPELQAALDQYQGDFLQGFFLRNAPDFENWLVSRRTYYRDLALSGWQTLANRYAQQADLTQAISAARQLLALEPWHEATHRSLMRWLAQTGQRGAALAQFDLCRRQLAEELDVEPSAETLALYEEVRAGKLDKEMGRSASSAEPRQEEGEKVLVAATFENQKTIPPATSHTPLTNLPAQPTPFVGRQQEVADVLQRLADPNCRLLTLVGPGGMGKTRLALEAAKASYALRNSRPEVAEASRDTEALNQATAPFTIHHSQFSEFSAGIYFVPLTTVGTVGGLVAAMAEAVGFTFYNNAPAQQQLLGYLADKAVLFVLDNFEHLLSGIDLLVDLLNAAPGVKFLVTSRELLNLQEEWLYPIGGLSLPPADVHKLDGLAEVDAVRFFVQCAQRVRPGFDLSKEWRCVLRICRQLEGMPLGIELATSWLKALGCHEIASEIQHNLDFLSTRLHNVPARHRSMRAVFEHSWQLLSFEEQRVLCRLSALHGFCQDAAATLAGASLFTLTTLAEKSLVQVLRTEGHGRYQLHELLRQFAAEKLQADAAEQALLQAQLSNYYLTRLADEASALSGAQQRDALATLSEETENIRTAWLWAANHAQWTEIGQSVDALYAFYNSSHRYQEGVDLLEAALHVRTQTPSENNGGLVRKLLNRQGSLYANLGQFERAQRLLSSGLTHAESLNLPVERAFCQHILGEMAGWMGDFAQGIRRLNESLALRRQLADQAGIASSLARLAEFTLGLDDYVAANQYGREYLSLARQLGNHRFAAHALRMLAYNIFSQGDFALSIDYCRQGLPLAEITGDQLELSLMLSLDLLNSTMVGALPLAKVKEQAQRSLSLMQATGHRYYVAVQCYILAKVLNDYQELQLGQQYCVEGMQVAQEVHATAIRCACQAVLGDVLCQQGDLRSSRQTLWAALQLGSSIGNAKFLNETLVYVGELLLAESDTMAGEAALEQRCRAVAILSFTHQHPACIANLRVRAGRFLTTLAAELPPDRFAAAQARGRQMTLEDAVAESLGQ